MPTYKDLAKTSGLVAFVQVAQMVFSLVRNKTISVLLGSAAFGLYSLYGTLVQMGSSIALFGLNNSLVREIARCSNKQQIGRVYYVCSRLIGTFSLIVCALILIFAEEIGQYAFNEGGHAGGVRCVAFIVLFMVASQEGYAVLNGIRSMRRLAISQIVSSGAGSLGTVLAVLLWREDAIPAALGIIAVTMAVVTYIYVRMEGIREVRVGWSDFKGISRTLIYIGIGVTVAGVVRTVMSFLSKSFLTEHYTLSAVGLYESSWTISNLYTGIILSAMGVDFMPRLSKIIDDHKQAVSLINQQILFGVVVASLAITGIMLFSKEILYIIYAKEFEPAANIVRWHTVGVFLRVIAFPFSYTILAKGSAFIFAAVQTLVWMSDYLLLMLCSHLWGFEGLGVNYLIAVSFYLLLAYLAGKHICGFSFSRELKKVLCVLSLFIGVSWAWVSCDIANVGWKYAVNIVLLAVHFFYVNRYLKTKMDLNFVELIKNKIRKR